MNKTPSIDTKKMIKNIREGKYTPEKKEQPKKNLDVHGMLKITRKLSENTDAYLQNKITIYDQKNEEEKFRQFFNDLNVVVDFIPLEVYDNLVFWGGTIDGIIKFVYRVTPEEKTSGVEFRYPEDFSPENPDDEEIIKRIESFYDTFYKYWRDNIIAK